MGSTNGSASLAILFLLLDALLLLGVFWFARAYLRGAREKASLTVELARRGAEVETSRLRSDAALEAERMRAESRRESDASRTEVDAARRDLARSREALSSAEAQLRLREERVAREDAAVRAAREAVRASHRQAREQLQMMAGLSAEEVRLRLLQEVRVECEEELRQTRRELLGRGEQELQREANDKLIAVMQRLASKPNTDLTATLVSLPNDEMKGRIIGREGRNIKSFEAATGVTLLIDDSPQTVLISSFDPVRREIARIALQRLITDGRIHPAAIEEMVSRAQKEVEEGVAASAEAAVEQLRLGGLNSDTLVHLGRLKFRFSYSQNVLDHSLEVARICALMAAELGLDPALARRAGLLHDIGKAMPAEMEGSHAKVGADFMRRQGESAVVCNAIAAHHEEEPPASLYAGLVILADRISAVRPGARAESLAAYVDRLDRLEKIALSLPGVQSAYAISAGREVRVIVAPETVDDGQAADLARTLRRRIEDSLQYPSTIRVVVVREQRFTETAR